MILNFHILAGVPVLLSLFGTARSRAADRYVSPTGVAGSAGTKTAPWSLGNAMSRAQPGDVVYFRGGVYANAWLGEITVSGTASQPIVYTAYPGEKVVIDGTNAGRSMPDDGAMRGLVALTNRAYVTIDGWEIRNLGTRNSSDVAGVLIRGSSHHITLRRCNIHHIETSLSNSDGPEGTANGIAVLGQNGNASVNNLTIDQCEVHDLKSGWSESVTINGNVENFRITNCFIHDCNNIGIDCIGFERVVPQGGANDRARNGLVQGNVISGIDSSRNPAYGGSRAADGIYVDGGKNILIQQNRVTDCNLGIELGCEYPGQTAAGCTVRNNFIWKNHLGGIFLGGAEPGVNGGAFGNTICNNTLYQNDVTPDRVAEVVIQSNAVNNTVKNNLIMASTLNRYVCNWSGEGNRGNVVDWNVYYSPSAATAPWLSSWQWQGNYRQGFGAWKALSGLDAHSTFADPQFLSVTAATLDLHIAATSAARDRSDPAVPSSAGEQDIDGEARAADGKQDVGADEYVPPTSAKSAK